MSNPESLREDLTRLELLLETAGNLCREIEEKHDIRFACADPEWGYPGRRSTIQFMKGIDRVAAALGVPTTTEPREDELREYRIFYHNDHRYLQLPAVGSLEYR